MQPSACCSDGHDKNCLKSPFVPTLTSSLTAAFALHYSSVGPPKSPSAIILSRIEDLGHLPAARRRFDRIN